MCVLCSAFLHSQFAVDVIFCQKEIGKKVFLKCWWNWLQGIIITQNEDKSEEDSKNSSRGRKKRSTEENSEEKKTEVSKKNDKESDPNGHSHISSDQVKFRCSTVVKLGYNEFTDITKT